MTDKQIIIDECNVSECKYFNGYQRIVRNNECIVDMQNACIEEIKTKPCSQKHNCYFKNWQRKEQECEELKEELKLEKDLNKDLLKEYWEEKKSLTDANAKLIKGLMVHKEKYAELKKEIETLKKLLKEENCNFDKIKDLTND